MKVYTIYSDNTTECAPLQVTNPQRKGNCKWEKLIIVLEHVYSQNLEVHYA